MYEVFGEFNSSEEINKAAAGLKAEGDLDNIKVLAKENGIDEEFAEAYINGEIGVLTNTPLAAVGKIELEIEEIDDPFFADMKEDMISYLLTSCSNNEDLAKAIRKKGKSLNGCFEYCKEKITEKLKSTNGGLRDRVVYDMQKEYYLKED